MPKEKRTDEGYKKKVQYSIDYSKTHYKRIPLDVTPEKYDQIKTASDLLGETVNGYIKSAIDTRLNSGK